MNIGQKIKEQRELKSLSVEKLATLINDNVENIKKYEANELEPMLDKKIALCNALDLTLDDLSYTIEHKTNYQKIENDDTVTIDETEEIVETPFASSAILYDEVVYKEVFQKDYLRFCLQSLITLIGYIIILGYSYVLQFNIFIYIMYVLTGYSLLKFIFALFNYFTNKKKWLQQYGGNKRDYYFYHSYIEINDSNNNETKKIDYSSIVRVIEKDRFFICMCLLDIQTILIIDKSKLNEQEQVIIRSTLKEACLVYIEQSKARKDQQTYTKKEKVINTINLVSFILSIVSVLIVNLIFQFFKLDDLLINYILCYGICLIFPITSIIIGIISNHKFKIKTKKNIIIGIVMSAFCLIFIGIAFINNLILTSENNNPLKDATEQIGNLPISNIYYTLFIDKDLEVVINEQPYIIESSQIWQIPKTSDVKKFELGLNSSNWNTNNEYSSYFELSENAKETLKLYQYDIEEQPKYFLLGNLDTKQSTNHIEQGNYVFACYYEQANYMLVVNFKSK